MVVLHHCGLDSIACYITPILLPSPHQHTLHFPCTDSKIIDTASILGDTVDPVESKATLCRPVFQSVVRNNYLISFLQQYVEFNENRSKFAFTVV